MAVMSGRVWFYETLQEGYQDICHMVVDQGNLVSPRGMTTRELLCPTLIINDSARCLPVGIGRGASLHVAAVEAVQLCGQFHDPDLMVAASPSFQRFREPYTQQMHGAYGNRVKGQIEYVVRTLHKDPSSRQAVITLWDPSLDFQPNKLDYPCTVALQFLIRENKLRCITDMRSNDVWLGLAYDLFQFSQLQWTIANMLEMEAGPIIHRPVSLHAYEINFEAINGLHKPTTNPPALYGFRSWAVASRIGRNKIHDKPYSESEQWFIDHLLPIREKVGRT